MAVSNRSVEITRASRAASGPAGSMPPSWLLSSASRSHDIAPAAAAAGPGAASHAFEDAINDLPNRLRHYQSLWENAASSAQGLKIALARLEDERPVLFQALALIQTARRPDLATTFAQFSELLTLLLPRAVLFDAFFGLVHALQYKASLVRSPSTTFLPRSAPVQKESEDREEGSSSSTSSSSTSHAAVAGDTAARNRAPTTTSSALSQEPPHAYEGAILLRPIRIRPGAPVTPAATLISARQMGVSTAALRFACELCSEFGRQPSALALLQIALESGREDLRTEAAETHLQAQGPVAQMQKTLLTAARLHAGADILASARTCLDEAESLARALYSAAGLVEPLADVHEQRGALFTATLKLPEALVEFHRALELIRGGRGSGKETGSERVVTESGLGNGSGGGGGGTSTFGNRREGFILAQIGRVFFALGRPEHAADMYQRSAAMLAGAYGGSVPPEMALIHKWLGEAFTAMWMPTAALEPLHVAKEIVRKVYGGTDDRQSTPLADIDLELALALREVGRGERRVARALVAAACEEVADVYGAEHPRARRAYSRQMAIEGKKSTTCGFM